MLYYVITNKEENLFYSADLDIISKKYPELYMSKIEAQAALNFIDLEIKEEYKLKVMPARLIVQTGTSNA